MAWSAAGYPGTVDAPSWARLSKVLGGRFAVFTGWQVSGVAGTRLLKITAGSGWGDGVLDGCDADETLSCGANALTVPRWDTVVVRRNHDTKTSGFAVVAGNNTQAYASGLNTNWGVLSDQPIALVQVPAGATSLVGAEVVPIRPESPRSMVLDGEMPPPGPLLVGDMWWTTTGIGRIWDGTAWQMIAGAPAPFAIARAASNADVTLVKDQTNRVSITSVEAAAGVSISGGRFVVSISGLYWLTAVQRFTGTVGAAAIFSARLNSTSTGTGGSMVMADWVTIPASGNVVAHLRRLVRLTAGDYVQLFRSAGSAGVIAQGGDTEFHAVLELDRRNL